MSEFPAHDLIEAVEDLSRRLRDTPGVVALSDGLEGERKVILVFVDDDAAAPDIASKIPHQHLGFEVLIRRSGPIIPHGAL